MSRSPSHIAAPKAWGAPLHRIDLLWTRVEQALAVVVIIAEIVALTVWVSVKSLASTYTPGGNVIGLIFRSIVSAAVVGAIVHLATRRQKKPVRNGIAVTVATIAGLFLGPVWVSFGVGWFSNLAEWLTNASVLTLIGGPRGLVTRLTLWVALLGASLAASKGKHINIDVATRFLPSRFALPVAIVGWLAAALVCFAASWGFVDSIAVTKFRAEAFRSCEGGDDSAMKLCDTPVGERLAAVTKGASSDLFMLGRQISLDLRTMREVVAGRPYDQWLDAARWNAWVKEGAWEEHFPKDAVESMALPTDDPNVRKTPAVVAPDTGQSRELLIRDLNFILPFGLFVIGLKFLLLILRALSGHATVAPEAAHDDPDLKVAHGDAASGEAR